MRESYHLFVVVMARVSGVMSAPSKETNASTSMPEPQFGICLE